MSQHVFDFVNESPFCASFLGFGAFYFSSQSEMPLYAPPGAACTLSSDEPLNRAFGLKLEYAQHDARFQGDEPLNRAFGLKPLGLAPASSALP